MPLLVTRASSSNESIALAKFYCTLSHQYSIAKLRSFDNGTSAIFISFFGLHLMYNSMQRKYAAKVSHGVCGG